jgi:branched-chain amino acid aminotransferase
MPVKTPVGTRTVSTPRGASAVQQRAGKPTRGAAPSAPKARPARVDTRKLPSLSLRHIWSGEGEIGREPLVWVNGRLVPKNEAVVSVYDHGLLYGDGVFEGIRVYRGRIFKCQSHLERLYRCAEKIHLRVPVAPDQMVQIQRDCIAANRITEGYIRLVVTRGYGTLGLDPRKCPVPGVICIADQINLYPPEFYETGMRVVVAQRPKTPIPCLDPRIKSLNYLNNILAKVEAIEAGCHEAIMLSLDGYVTECTGDNIFIIKDGRLFTPPTVSGEREWGGLLEGVTRRFVKEELAAMCGLAVEEKLMRIEEVLGADEVFLTGTAAEIIAVTQVGEHRITDSEGPVTNKLRMKFREVVTGDPIPEN